MENVSDKHLVMITLFSLFFSSQVNAVCGDPATLISAVQGTGARSPMVGDVVAIEAVVVGDFQGAGELGGFFVQEEDAHADSDPRSSEGIFVASIRKVGFRDRVRVSGTVREKDGRTQISGVTNIQKCAGMVPVPKATRVTLPRASMDFFERFEGMSVFAPQKLVISDHFNAVELGSITVSSERLYSPTAVAPPGAPASTVAANNEMDRLILDDGRSQSFQTPWIRGQDDLNEIDGLNPIRTGQTISGVRGLMDYSNNDYRIQRINPGVINEGGQPRTTAPSLVPGTLRLAAYNVLNFFTTLDDSGPVCGPFKTSGCWGADNAAEFARQLDKLTSAISAIDADIVGLIELENNPQASLKALVDGLNAMIGAGTYRFINSGYVGSANQKVGLIYKPATVTPEGPFAVLDSKVDPRFSSLNRPALAQSFRARDNAALITVAVNHFKSKGCFGATGGNSDQGDGQGCYNPARKDAAEALGDWMNSDPTGTGARNSIILGDLNSFPMEDPIVELQARDFTNLGDLYEGLGAYSLAFMGQVGALDYALSNPALTPRVVDVETWHVNADEMRAFDYNTEDFGVTPKPADFFNVDPYRSSDHDPIVVELDMNPPRFCITPDKDCWTPHRFLDFDKDGKDDVLLRNRKTGSWQINFMRFLKVLAKSGSAPIFKNMDWEMMGSGDFNGDGLGDVLVRSKKSGTWWMFLMKGRTQVNGATQMFSDQAWVFAGIHDFDGDGKDDVLLRNLKTGRWTINFMNGFMVMPNSGSTPIFTNLDWRMMGTGDFNGDGRGDVTLRHKKSGAWWVFFMNGRTRMGGRSDITQNRSWVIPVNMTKQVSLPN